MAGSESSLSVNIEGTARAGPVRGRVLPGGKAQFSGSPEARREGLRLPKHKSQATGSGGGTLGQAGKPQFITKMENDTSLCACPGGGLIYGYTRAGTFVSAAQHECVCRALIACY